jgi:uncharacterized protein YdbL (DUF1318 family)
VLDAEFTVTGLTPGAMNVDAAYAVQVLVASTNIKYGGPNTNAGANAWGGFLFEAWDPQPQSANSTLTVDASGRVDVSKVAGTAQTARDLGAQLDATVSSRMATFTLPTNFSAMAITAGGAVTAGTVSDKTGYALTAAYDPAKTAAQSTDYTTARAAKLDNLDALVSSRLATASYTTPPTAAAVRAEMDANSAGLASIFARTDGNVYAARRGVIHRAGQRRSRGDQGEDRQPGLHDGRKGRRGPLLRERPGDHGLGHRSLAVEGAVSLYFVGWGKNFIGWGTAPAAAATTVKAGAGKTIVIPKKKPVFIAAPAPKRRESDDDDAILIHLLQ